MTSKTTILAIRTLLFLARQPQPVVFTPRSIAESLHESPSYLPKVTRLLARAGILRAEKGVHGGVHLARPPERVTLLEIVEACQGAVLADVCQDGCKTGRTCSFHASAEELRTAVVDVYSRWTLARLMEKPSIARRGLSTAMPCLMSDPGGTIQ